MLGKFKVRCIENPNQDANLEIGKEYTAVGYDRYSVILDIETNIGDYYIDKQFFEVVEEKKEEVVEVIEEKTETEVVEGHRADMMYVVDRTLDIIEKKLLEVK